MVWESYGCMVAARAKSIPLAYASTALIYSPIASVMSKSSTSFRSAALTPVPPVLIVADPSLSQVI